MMSDQGSTFFRMGKRVSITNSFDDSLQSLKKAVAPEDPEVIERAPEINPNKRKSKKNMRQTTHSIDVGESSKRCQSSV